MRFFCINRKGTNASITSLLRETCQKKEVEYIEIDPNSFNYAQLNPAQDGDSVYRVSKGVSAKTVERYLLSAQVKTFYKTLMRGFTEVDNVIQATLLHQASDILIPKTVYGLPSDQSILKEYVDYLGGFPVVVKVVGGSHGKGVIKVDSYDSLLSIVDFLRLRGEKAIIRQYINVSTSARLIVLGDKVIDSIEYIAPEGDFRSNEGAAPKVVVKDFKDEINQAAVEAVRVLGIEFGGVDILIDESGKYYVLEVNFPCNFARAQNLTGNDITGQMIDYLIGKKV